MRKAFSTQRLSKIERVATCSRIRPWQPALKARGPREKYGRKDRRLMFSMESPVYDVALGGAWFEEKGFQVEPLAGQTILERSSAGGAKTG
jgi:hypothetical protein